VLLAVAAVAGSAEQFRKVDFEYVAATAAKAAGMPYFGLVSAQVGTMCVCGGGALTIV
jgi:hypothetical protein